MITERNMKQSKKRVLLGMSGGVDSSVAAYLLKEEGYDVIGVTLQMWHGETDKTVLENSQKANDICNQLNITHYTFNVEKEFKKYVLDYFISEYENGRTPNPCVICNRYVKFEGLIQKARELDIEYIATGHYANIEKKGNRFLLKKGEDINKDQSYFLYNLSQEQLSKTIFPLGKYTKSEVREIAKKIKLLSASEPDSQEICFIKDNNYRSFLQNYGTKIIPKGEIVDTQGNILGYHEGISKYTIGQRRGLGVHTGEPMFVIDIDKEGNRVVLGSNENLQSKELIANTINWIYFDKFESNLKAKVKIRHGAKEVSANLIPFGENNVKVEFDSLQRAVTKGQSVVFYLHNYILGGGIIT